MDRVRNKVDLHMHSTCSDGIYRPSELIAQAEAAGLRIIAVTDHDTIAGGYLAYCNLTSSFSPAHCIPGLEINTEYQGHTVHVLGYCITDRNVRLRMALEWMRRSRIVRMERIVAKLKALNYAITLEECYALAGKGQSLGRPHAARVLISKGYFATIAEVFNELLGKGKKAYVPQDKFTPAAACELIRGAKGLSILAHPAEIGSHAIVEELLCSGAFDGVEIYHPSATEEEKIRWFGFARKRHLLITGGSDYHGSPDRYPAKLGEFAVYEDDVAEFLAACRRLMEHRAVPLCPFI